MKIEIELPLHDLKQALAGLSKVMNRSGLPALRCVRIARSELGHVSLSATDVQSVATYRVKEPVPGVPVTMLVPWELFTKVVKATKDRAVFAREKADQVAARYFVGSMSFEEPAAMPPLDEWPKFPSPGNAPQLMKPAFMTAFAEALQSASTDGTRAILNGVCLDVSREEGHYVVATNGRRLYSANSFRFDFPHSMVIPDRKFLRWHGFYTNGDWKLRPRWEEKPEDGGWLEIESDDWTFATFLTLGLYPNWRQIFPSETTGLATVMLGPGAVQALLEAIPVVQTQEPHNPDNVCFDASPSGLSLMIRSAPGSPWTELPIPDAQVSGDPNITLVKKEQILSALRLGFTQIEFREALTPVVLRAPGRQMALGPVNGEKPEPAIEPSQPSAAQPLPTETETNHPRNSNSNPMNTNSNINTHTNTSINTSITADRSKAFSPTSTLAPAEETPIRAAMAHIETIRNSFREGLNGLNQAMALLKAAERDQKSSDKEIESVRSTLRSLQRVQI